MDSKSYKKVAVAIVKNPEGKLLIVKRKHKKQSVDGSVLEWTFPGTECDSENTEGLVQFVENETGQKIKPVKKISQRIYHPLGYDLSYYESDLIESRETAQKSEKVAEFKWVDKSDLHDYFSTNIDNGVRMYLEI